MTIIFFVAQTAIVQQLRARLNPRRFPEVDMFKVLLFGTGATIGYFGRGDLLSKSFAAASAISRFAFSCVTRKAGVYGLGKSFPIPPSVPG
jgi:hypothetical protein